MLGELLVGAVDVLDVDVVSRLQKEVLGVVLGGVVVVSCWLLLLL